MGKAFTMTVEELRESAGKAFAEPFNELKTSVDRVQDRMDELDARQQKGALYGGARTTAVEGKGPFLGLERKAAPHFEADSTDYGFDPSQVRLGALIAGYVNDGAKKRLNGEEQKALSTLIGAQGDLLIPTAIGSLFIDAVRPKTAVLAAGGLTYPMEARSVILPGWDVPPKAGWRGEGGSFTAGGGTFREVVLNAKDVGAYTDVPNVLFEDAASNVGPVADLIEGQLTKAIAQAIDLAALTSQDALSGAGTHVPIGLTSVASDGTVSTNYGVPLATSSGTNGGTPTNYDWFIDAAAGVYGANFTPTAHLGASRTFATLGKLKTTTNEYLPKPPYLAGVQDFQTNQLGVAFKKGSASNASVSVVGDFSNLVIGMRSELAILRDPFTQGISRTTRLIVSMRADVAVLNAPAFTAIDGILP